MSTRTQDEPITLAAAGRAPHPPRPAPGPGGDVFMPCLPCTLPMEEQVCRGCAPCVPCARTTRWCCSYRFLDFALSSLVVVVCLYATVALEWWSVVRPGTPVFALVLVWLGAYGLGWLCYARFTLPATTGMLVVALLYRNTALWELTGEHLDAHLILTLKSFLLTVCMVRCGAYFEGDAFQKYRYTVLLIGILPNILEGVTVGLVSHGLLKISVLHSFVLGFILTGVSPILMSHNLVSLAKRGYGAKTGILGIVLYATQFDNNTTVIIFSVLLAVDTQEGTLPHLVLMAIVRVVISIVAGVLSGWILTFFPHKHNRRATLLRFALLLTSSVCVHLTCHHFKYEVNGYLFTLTATSFMVNCFRIMGWSKDLMPLRESLEMLWHGVQPLMIVVSAMDISFSAMEAEIVWKSIITLTLGTAVRFTTSYALSEISGMSVRQRLMLALTWTSKGLLQSELGSLVSRELKDQVEAEHMLTVVRLNYVLSGLCIPPLVMFTGPHLLPRD